MFLKIYFWCGCCSLLIFVATKATKGTELSFLCKQGTLSGGRVDHRMMFPRHLHLPQLYIQAIPYIYKTDYMMSLTLYTLTSVCIFSILSSMGDPKTLTPGPWTTLRTGPRTPSTDPPYGPPQKIAKKWPKKKTMQKIEIEMTKRFDLPFEWTDRSCRRKFERLLPQN